MTRDKTIGLLSAGLIYFIYGVNIVFCKDLLNSNVSSPTILLLVRIAGAAALFWLYSLLFVHERIDRKDLWRIFLASLLGVSIPFLSTIWGLTMSTPSDASMINSLKPLFAILASYLLFKERPTASTWTGIFIAILGVVLLVLAGADLDSSFKTTPLGLLILSINGLSFSFYLALFKPLVKKYHPVSFMKWSMLFAFLCILPAAIPDIHHINMSLLSTKMYFEMAFLIIAATFITYLLSPTAQKRLSPTQYCIFSYIQPLSASLLSILLGFDVFSWQKLAAMILMTVGVFLSISDRFSR